MQPAQAEARPAVPLLASSLLGDDELNELIGRTCDIRQKRRGGREKLGTGVKSLDDALAGGLVDGRVISVSGDGTGGSEVCRTLLVSSLLRYPGSMAAVIDTTGNLDVLKLYTLILSKLQGSPDLQASVRAATKCGTPKALDDVAAKVLDHVKIMRAFDFVGVREAIGEIRDELEGRRHSKRQTKDAVNEPVMEVRPPTRAPEPQPQSPSKRTVVADSEDEEDGEEMLFDTSAPQIEPAPALKPTPVSARTDSNNTHEEAESDTLEGEGTGKVKFLLVDNLAQVLNPLLKKEYLTANALASTFLHSLTHLTRTHALHTVLANSATHPRAKSPSRQAPSTSNLAPQPPEPPKQQAPPPSPSVFASSTIVPSLSGVLARYVDVGLLVSQMPRKKMDARVFYRDGGDASRGVVKKLRGVEMVGVMEVVSDRSEGRVGAWGVFVEGEKGIRDVL